MRFLLIVLLVIFLGCGQKPEESGSIDSVQKSTEVKLPKIVAFGDSLTAGLGLPLSQSYPAVLQKLLEADGFHYEVINAGVSGDTTSGGLRRIDWSLDGDVRFLILELGANDVLRGQPISLVKSNLGAIIEKAQKKNVKVLMSGMEAPYNAGPEYRKEVHQAFLDLQSQYDVIPIPFVLKDVFGHEKLIQEDGSHPTAEGAKLIAENVYKALKPLL